MSPILMLFLLSMAAIVERTKVSVPRLAKEWGVSTKKITDFIKAGELKAINIATSRDKRPRYLLDRRDIEQFERGRVVVPIVGEPARKLRRRTARQVKEYF